MKNYPLEIERKNIKFRFIKEYEKFGLYESISGGYKACFGASDLGLLRRFDVKKLDKLIDENISITSLLS